MSPMVTTMIGPHGLNMNNVVNPLDFVFMSLANSPDCSFRPEDKALKMLFPSVEDPINNSFDEFFDRELYQLQSDDPSDGTPEDFHKIQTIPPNFNPSTRKINSEGEDPQPWRKGLWCLGDSTPGLVSEKSRRNTHSNRAFVSPTYLISNENIATKSPSRSVAVTVAKTKNFSSAPKAVIYSRNRYVRPPVTREQTLSPSPMYAQLPVHGDMTAHDSWQQDFQNFHLRVSDEKQIVSPTLVDHNFPRLNADLNQSNSRRVAQNSAVAYPPQSPTRYHYPFQHVARPESGPANGQAMGVIDSSFVAVSASQIAPEQLVAMPDPYQYVGAEQGGTPLWTTESLHSSDSSYQSHNSQYSHEGLQQPYPPIPQHVWVSPEHQQQLRIDTSGRVQEYHGTLVAPVPQSTPHYILYQQQELNYDGLGIQYPAVHEIGRAVDYTPENSYHRQTRSITPFQSNQALINPFLNSYPPLPLPPSEELADISPFTTPRRHLKSMSRSPSPQTSPNHASSARSLRQRSPSRCENTHNRRKSINKAGPIKDNAREGTTRARSSSRPAKTPRTPKTPTGGFQVDFVNFTPKDSAKLMADVAPSGSSKTRARRDQEAKDKRKKLADAALREVQRAGGDVLALKKAGILV